MDSLYEIVSNDKYDETTKINISYKKLKLISESGLVAPTIHRYLYPHVKSRFVEITFDNWDVALMLPVQQFKKASKEKVWRDSEKKIYNR